MAKTDMAKLKYVVVKLPWICQVEVAISQKAQSSPCFRCADSRQPAAAVSPTFAGSNRHAVFAIELMNRPVLDFH